MTHTEAGSYANTASVTVRTTRTTRPRNDNETVTVTDVLPTVDLTKTVDPADLPEPGGVFDFTLTITNRLGRSGDDHDPRPTTTPLTAECLGPDRHHAGRRRLDLLQLHVTHTEAGSYPTPPT